MSNRNKRGCRVINRTYYYLYVRAIMAIVLAGSVMPAMSEDLQGNRAELIRSLLPAVVNISVRKDVAASPSAEVATASDRGAIKAYVGSGFIIDPSGLLVTNYHVVEDAFEISVTLSDGTELPGTMLHASRQADLAIVQIKTDHALKPVQWGDSNKLQVGDQVFAIGDPLGIGTSVSAGIVSGLHRDVQDSPYDNYIQTDAAINHGNSGGPLFDMEGHVVGVNTALVSPTESSAGLGLAIPADSVRFVVDRLIEYGWVNPGWMGIKVQQVTREMAAAMGSQQPEGSVVSWVLPDSPAQKAGIEIGDIFIRYADYAPPDERALLRRIAHTPVGDTVQVALLHDGMPRVLPVTIESWPRSQWDKRDAPMTPERPKLTIPPDLGLTLSAVPTSERAQLGLEDGLSGVLIISVLGGSDAAERGMMDGDVILRVQDRLMTTPIDVQEAIRAVRSDHRPFVMMLVLPKVRKTPGPKWVTIRLPQGP
jgi:serine protease Do